MIHRRAGLVPIFAFVCLSAAVSAPERRRGPQNLNDAHIRIGRSYDLPAGSTLSEPLLVIGGSVTLDGDVEGTVTVVGGTTTEPVRCQ